MKDDVDRAEEGSNWVDKADKLAVVLHPLVAEDLLQRFRVTGRDRLAAAGDGANYVQAAPAEACHEPNYVLQALAGADGTRVSDHDGFGAGAPSSAKVTAVTPAGDIYVADGYGNARIVQFDRSGKYVREWGELGHKPGQFSIPHAIAVDSKGRLYVADRNNVRVQVFDPTGRFLAEWRDLMVPWGLCVTKGDEIWVCGSSPQHWRPKETWLGSPPRDQLFMKFNGDGKALQFWAVTFPPGEGRPGVDLKYHQMAVDSKGNLYGADLAGKRIQKLVRVPGDVK